MDGTPPQRRVIRVFPEYSRVWPLWEDTTPTSDVGYTTTPDTYDLSGPLRRDIAAWNALWVSRFDPFDGWDSAASRERWRVEGERIVARLRREVASFADVQYEPWPLENEADGQQGSSSTGR